MKHFYKDGKKNDTKEKVEQVHGKKSQKFRYDGYTPNRRSKSNKLMKYIRIDNR
jgi:hypothetical protein